MYAISICATFSWTQKWHKARPYCIGYWDLKSVQTYPLKTALLTFYYVKQPFSGPDLSVLEGMKCPFLDFTYLLMC